MAKPTFEEFQAQRAAQQNNAVHPVQNKPTFEEFQAKKRAANATNESNAQPEYQQGNTFAGDIAHKAGVAARGVLEGAAGIPVGLYNAVGMLKSPNAIETPLSLPTNIPRENDQLVKLASGAADLVGLPKATHDDNLTQQVSEAVGGFAAPAGLASKFGTAGSMLQKAGNFMGGATPVKTGLQMAAGIASGNAAKGVVSDNENMSQGQKTAVEIGANILGNMGTGGMLGVAGGLSRAAARAGGAMTGNVEGVAGRFLNRVAGDEAGLVQGYLERGAVPTIDKPILGYQPRSSEIAANAGISGAVRHAENDITNSTSLTGRDFANQQTVKDFLQRKTAGTAESRQAMDDTLRADAAANSQAFKDRNAPVDLESVRQSLIAAIDKNSSNPYITDGLNRVLSDMPKAKTVSREQFWSNPETGRSGVNMVDETVPVGVKDAYNYKQYIDEMLRGNAFDNPTMRSIQQSGTALGNTKKALSDAITSVEPEFAPFLQRQADGIARLERQKLADKLIQQLSNNSTVASNQSGAQEAMNFISAPKINQLLKNDKVAGKLSESQIEAFNRAAQHAELKTRASAGLPRNSATAQNLKTDQLIADDIARALYGDKQKTGLIGGLLKAGTRIASDSPLLRTLSPVGSRQTELSNIFARAELEPEYMAELMKKYKLGNSAIDPTAKGAARAIILGAGTRSR